MDWSASSFPRKATLATLLGFALMLDGCRLRESASEDLVIPEVVRTNLYVSPSGSDSNPGTRDEPFRTIMRAAHVATPGTTVHVAPGVYSGGFKTTNSGTAEARIIYQSTERWGARIVPPLDSRTPTAWDNRGNYVDIVGFDVDGSLYQSGMKWLTGIYNGGSYNSVRHNHVHHIATDVPCESKGGSGIGVDSYYKGVKGEVIGNSVHDMGPPGCRFVHGIYISTSATVKNNIVYRISGAGIHLWHDANNVIITGNTVSTSGTGIVVGSGDYYHSKGPNDHTHVSNNIVFDNKHGIMEQGATGKHNSYRNNLVFQNAAFDWRLSHGRTHSGTVAAPPLFVEYSRTGTPDFRLTEKSPAIGKGIGTHAEDRDFLGKPRSTSTGYDIGAVQHQEP
jgi:parallel beta-helix repeat protein